MNIFVRRGSTKKRVAKHLGMVLLIITGLILSACSGEGFHLRGSVALPDIYQRVYLQGSDIDHEFQKGLEKAFEEMGGELVSDVAKATAIVQIDDYKEGKRVAGYGPNREVRQYLIFLRFQYVTKSTVNNRVLLPITKVNLDKTQIYDSEFVLGKIEEERLIKEDLRSNAARHIMLRLRYGK